MTNYKQEVDSVITPGLIDLRDEFQKRGFDLRLVGGIVRDIVRGVKANDVDLCTDANPDEQREVYEAMKAREFSSFDFIPTGEQHGTFTVIPCRGGEGFEITSLRTESEHDGRYAVMTYTRDWTEDLSRRDFTINAMALTFDGDLIDPFGGKADLEAKVVRFVGDATARMTEDYLRIMRYFRFLGRISEYKMDMEELESVMPKEAILECMPGLRRISVERIWAEVSKIMNDPRSRWVYPLMLQMGIHEHTALPAGDEWQVAKYNHLSWQVTGGDKLPIITPDVLMSSFFKDEAHAEAVAKALKWSADDREAAKHIMSYKGVATDDSMEYQIMVKGRKPHHVAKAAAFFGVKGMYSCHKTSYEQFPQVGEALKAAGIKPGPHMGALIHDLKERWFYSGATLTVDDMVQIALEQ